MPPVFEIGPAGKIKLEPKSRIDFRNEKHKKIGRIVVSDSGNIFTYYDEYGFPHLYLEGESTTIGFTRYSSEKPVL